MGKSSFLKSGMTFLMINANKLEEHIDFDDEQLNT